MKAVSIIPLLCVIFLVAPETSSSPVDLQRRSFVKVVSPVSVPTKLRLNTEGSGKHLIRKDLARAKKLRECGTPRFNVTRPPAVKFSDGPTVEVSLRNIGVFFTTQVQIGSPGKSYELLVDTGSSNTVLATRAHYEKTSTSRNTTQRVNITYGSGKLEGYEFIDFVALGNGSIPSQSIGISERDEAFDSFDGILGLGPTDLTIGTVQGVTTIPTVADNLAMNDQIQQAVVGISFPPSTTNPQSDNGSLSFGAPDPTRFTGEVRYVPITRTRPASAYWGIDQSISYGSSKIPILNTTAGIVDTGTTLLMLATDAFQAYVQATGAKPDTSTGLLKIDSAENLQSLFFNMGNTTFEFTANAQMWPHIYNTAIGGEANATYLIVGDLKKPSGRGLDFVNGFAFLQRFYSVYDTPQARMGFATTPYTNATSN